MMLLNFVIVMPLGWNMLGLMRKLGLFWLRILVLLRIASDFMPLCRLFCVTIGWVSQFNLKPLLL